MTIVTSREIRKHGHPGDPGYFLLHPKSKFSRTYPSASHDGLFDLYGPVLREHFKRHKKDKFVLSAYMLDSYEAINTPLRTGTLAMRRHDAQEIADHIDAMDRITRLQPTTEDLVVFRGADKSFYSKLQVGVQFVDAGFGSSSIDQAIADDFVHNIAGVKEKNSVMIKIKAPKGTKAVYASVLQFGYRGKTNHGDYAKRGYADSQKELIFARNTTYEVESIVDGVITLKVVSQE